MQPHLQAGWVVAAVAGVFSFLSPCVLPLIPGYLSMISGLTVEQLRERPGSQLLRILFSCVLFSAGFTPVYILVGLSAGTIGSWLASYRTAINVVFGMVVIAFGLFVVGLLRIPFLYRERRLRIGGTSLGIWGAPLVGLAFAFGWTPCIGPWAGTLLGIAQNQTPAQSALLFAIFGTTFGLCFTAAGVFFAYALRAFTFLQRHYRVIEITSGALLIAIGVLLATQQWDWATAWLMGVLG